MNFVLRTRLAAPPERVWTELQRTALFAHVSAPIVSFRPMEGATPETLPDEPWHVRMSILGLPVGGHWIVASRHIEGETRRFHDAGHGDSIQKWDHWITVVSDGAEGTSFEDSVTIEAGWKTPFVTAFAWLLYRWRQHRWRRLVARGFRY